MSSHSDEVIKLHKIIVALGDGMPAYDVMAALALTVAYASRFCMDNSSTIDQGLKAFNQLVILEYFDPNSQMTKPREKQ